MCLLSRTVPRAPVRGDPRAAPASTRTPRAGHWAALAPGACRGAGMSRSDVKKNSAKPPPGRRFVGTVVVPGLALGLLTLGGPAYAGPPAGAGGSCNGVVNQLAHRGAVQQNLL